MDEKQPFSLLTIVLGIVTLLFLVRLLFAMRFMGLVLISLLMLILAGYFVLQNIRNRKQKKNFAQSTEGQILEKLDACRFELDKHQSAAQTITQNINEIKEQLNPSHNIDPQIEEDSKQLLAKYESELQLRNTKINFFQTCIQKLESLLQNHRLAKSLLQKEEKLRQLQEDHYEDIAKMEEIKSNVEMDTFYLETIQDLSQQIQFSTDLDNTESINRKLIKMTKDIERL